MTAAAAPESPASAPRPPREWGRPSRYALAALMTLTAFALRLALSDYLGPPYLLFYPAVVLSALYGGLGPGLFATALSGGLAALWILPSERPDALASTREAVSLAVFTLVSAFLSLLADRYRRSLRRIQDLQLEKARREGEARFGSMADTAPVLIWMSGLDMGCNWFNRPWLEFTGRTMAQEMGNGWAEGVHPDDLPSCLATYQDHFARRVPFHMDYRLRRHDGQYRWVSDAGTPRHDERGAFAGFIGSCIDVTERRQAEQALQESSSRLALFIRHAPSAIAMLDRELRYLAASERYLADYRLADQPVVGRSHYDLFPEIPERWREIHRRCLAGAVERCDEDPFPRADGLTDWVRWEIRPWRDAAGAIGGLILFSEVITARKEMEARASRAERLTAVATLVRGMSHEINNPLASVVTNLDFALEQVGSAPTQAVAAWSAMGHPPLSDLREALDDAAASADRIKAIVKDMNTFLPQAAYAERHCDPGEAMRRALKLAHHELVACAEVAVELGPLPAVPLSEEELVQVFASLLVNAGQSTGRAPNRIRVTGGRSAPDRVAVTIADTGEGMSPAVLAHAYEPFFTTKGVGRGKGLGLSLCRGIIDSAGGEITLQSAAGQGTSATVTLPACRPDQG